MSAQKEFADNRFVHFLLILALAGASVFAFTSAHAQAPANHSLQSAADSTAPMRDPFAAPPLPPLSDSQAVMPTVEAVKLSSQGTFSNSSPRVGDSLDYVITVEWEDTEVVVLAPDSLDFPGFKILGQATVHKKLASAGGVKNHTEFIYRLRAQTQGQGKATSMKIRYLTGISRQGQEEAVYIPTALTNIAPAPTRLADMLWFKLLLWVVILAGAGALAAAAFKLAIRKKSRQSVLPVDLKPEVMTLKNRLRSAQNTPDSSKAVLLEMEGLALRFLKDELGPGRTASATPGNTPVTSQAPRFEALLDDYLSRDGAGRQTGDGHGTAQDWARLREAFKHARFAGGYKEPHELQEDFRTLRKCLKITGDDQP
ncbi:MAG: hypothetical protein M3Y08_06435 [Fibrobacterota bacterium]|nr:hypothetical protein [Fibrobacterota bacterium]